MISGFCNSNPGIYLGFFMPATFCFVFVSALLVNSSIHHRYCADKRFNIKSFESLLSYTFLDSFLLLEGVNESHKSDTQYKGLLIY
ncbi:Secreted protein [Vibrio crassostreae]|nr:Secreted protein [Vibrio crassostreae]CAK2290546.1 Secreted protein [Vibrio crassostreae]CAK2311463.1 Secreted protein [Vibrio crassostreae]CAK3155411.1 Secreted protein [Vibrio crassostreae]